MVLGFLVPPGAGVNGVPLQVRQCLLLRLSPWFDLSLPTSLMWFQELFGFERVHVLAGQTVTVYLGAQGVRFTQADVDGVRRALPGLYTVRFGVAETVAYGMGFAELVVEAE